MLFKFSSVHSDFEPIFIEADSFGEACALFPSWFVDFLKSNPSMQWKIEAIVPADSPNPFTPYL